MRQKIFIGETKAVHSNPINDRHYQELLGLNPTLSGEIKKAVEHLLFDNISPIFKSELNSNFGIADKEQINQAKQELIHELQELSELTGETKHIKVVIDTCFTNTSLLLLLRKILGKSNFSQYVQVVEIDYEKPSQDAYLEEQLESNNCIILLGGSLSDVYSMDTSHYDGYLAQLIKNVSDEYYQKFLNKRILGTCFGQQFIANNIGLSQKNSSGIIATVEGPSQFGPSNCTIEDIAFVSPVYIEALNGLSGFGNNHEFTGVFTRNGYVNFDLLKTGGNLAVVPLIRDQMTDGIVGWGSKNGRILGIQFHPEVNLLEHKPYLQKHLKKVMQGNPSQELFLENFDVSSYVKKDIGEAFYVFALLAFIKDIKKTYLNLGDIYNEPDDEQVPYAEAVERLLSTTSGKVDYVLQNNQSISPKDWIKTIDQKGRLLMNYILDWKVNRSLPEVSDILGFQSIDQLVEKHMQTRDTNHYVIRDLGAGDGNTLHELHEKFAPKGAVVYGIGDYIYFDLYSSLKKKKEFVAHIPEELLILFVEKVIDEFKKVNSKSTIFRVRKALDNITFSKDDTISKSSMTSQTTSMFENENVVPLPQDIQNHFSDYLPELAKLKDFVIHNFYDLFHDSFQRIYISKFNDLYVDDAVISKVDFQFSIRSTSHISGREYMKVISDYFYNSAKPGSIFLDNGVHQSYTSIPRLKELYEVGLDLVDGKMQLIYDSKTNYFSSVIITKQEHFDQEFFGELLSPTSKIVPLREAYKSTFFRLEYFIRNFIISNFKNHIVFWDYNMNIINTLKVIMEKLVQKDIESIPQDILSLINHIATTYTNNGVLYNSIDISLLENYIIDGESLSKIIHSEVYIPEWMNIQANRKY